MRVKEIDRTANIAWSPENQYPIYVAAGTAAQQLDATFSTSSAIDIFALNLDEATLDMPVVASIPSDTRFHKLLWSDMKDTDNGVIIGGTEHGNINIYDAGKMLSGDEEGCLSTTLSRHSGAVKALDINPFQSNLLASGAGDSEIYIWDLQKTESPMTPGQKSQPPEELACVAWNRQVQHILGSTFASRCVVWDLRKNEPIIKVSDSMSRIRAKHLAWHPEVATQLCLSSEDDHTPVIQLWDLRYATSPLKSLENHTKGVLSVAWCLKDPDLLLSCGKDSRILCWNPNSNVPNGEVVYELNTSNQWCFDLQWCPRNPAIMSSASFDGHITLYSLMGGGHPIQPSNKVAESFGNAPFGTAPVQVPHEQEKVLPLQKPPKWIRKPVGASFAFGGKLVSFGMDKAAGSSASVTISQVVTETDLVVRSNQLEQALANGQFTEFCALKAANCNDTMQETLWNFMTVNFDKEPRTKFLQLLGYDQNELARKVIEHTGTEVAAMSTRGVDAQELAQKMSMLNTGNLLKVDRVAVSGGASPNVGSKTPDIDNLDELVDGTAAFDEIAAGSQKASEKPSEAATGTNTPLIIPTDKADGLMTQALLTGNFEAAVEMCLSEDKMAEAILLAIAGGPELLIRTQKKYFMKNKSTLGRLISSVVTHDWGQIVESCDLDNWKEALAVILTYALPEEFSPLCDVLASRLESERNGELSLYASLCYICSGNVDKLVDNWVKNTENGNQPLSLQDLVEKVMLLRKAVELSRGSAPNVSGGALAEKLSEYSSLLAAQGSLSTALSYLNNSTDVGLAILQDRLCRALGTSVGASPYQQVNVMPESSQTQAARSQTGGPASGFQATAGRSTTTTTTTNYYNQSQFNYAPMSKAGDTQTSTYNQQPVTSTAQSGHKGLSSNRYPKHPSTAPGYDNYYGGQVSQIPQQPAPMYTGQPNVYNPGSYNPPDPVHTSSYNPTPNSQIYSPQPTPAPSVFTPGQNFAPPPQSQPAMASYQDKPAECAWNDPPPIIEKAKSAPRAGGDQAPPGAPLYPGLYNPTEHQIAPKPMPSYNTGGNTFNSGGFTGYQQTPTPAAPSQTSHPQPPAPVVDPPKPVVKSPIPSEHMVLQTIFDQLVKSCLQNAPNAQMKRKLEDVTRKLELLYDKLRDNRLSQSVLLGLHQVIQAVQQYDYPSGLNVYTGMVAQGNFSEISNFMPAIKVLLQAASQMQVYVQQ